MMDRDVVNLHMDSHAVAFVNRMGGTRSQILCVAALELWKMVLSKKGWVKAHWVPREDNEQADMLSQLSLETWDFGLKTEVTEDLKQQWFHPVIDMFGSHTFHVCNKYYSSCPDPEAVRVDAFSAATWPNLLYAFSPPSLTWYPRLWPGSKRPE